MKNMKKILSLLLTVLMIMSSATMLFAHAEEGAEHTCADVSPKDHYCDDATCGKAINSTLVNFTGTNTDVVTYKNGGLRFDGTGKGNLSAVKDMGFAAFPLLDHKYEITYWFESNSSARAALSMYYQGARYGWGLRGTTNNQVLWYQNGTPKATVTTPVRDVDDNGRSYYKVIFDGFNNTMSLYVLSGGEYKRADTRAITVTASSKFYFYLFCYDTLATGQYMEYGDLTINTLCADTNKDHKCDICGEVCSDCSDATSDNDHKCDSCGKDMTINVDFTGNGAGSFIGSDLGGATYNISEDGKTLSVTSSTNTNKNIGVKFPDLKILNKVYEITYSWKDTTNSNHWQAFMVVWGTAYQGYMTRNQSGYETQLGFSQHQGSGCDVGLGAKSAFVPDENGYRHLKVIVNGVDKTLSLYIKSGDEYVLLDKDRAMENSVQKINESAFLSLNIRAYRPFTTGELTVTNATITEICYDKIDDTDHKCEECAKDGITPCTDVDNDGNHACDICGKADVTECKNDVPDHTCDTDSACTAFNECINLNGDTVCDLCGTDMHVCVDAKVNETGDTTKKDHLCDICGKDKMGNHADGEKIDHLCDECLKPIVSEVVDFTSNTDDPDKGIDFTEGGIRFDGIGKGNLGAVKDMGAAAFPLLDHKYEITYWFEGNSSARAALSMYYQGARYGWGLRGTTNNQALWYQNGTVKGTVTTPVRDVDDNGRSYYKVIFDGFNNTMSLYVLSGGEYKRADTRAITVTASSKLYFYLFCYDTLATGEYMEYGDITINTFCTDSEVKDHKCDICGEVCSDCFDATSDNDHKCDICGADKVTECTDVANDGDHKCDECGADNITVCADVANDGDHKCDECGADNITVCADVANDGDHKCDECGADNITDCADVANDGDHKCDECGKGNMNACADVENDGDHKCDECGENMADAKCFDKEGDGDHNCDECGEPVASSICVEVVGDGDHNCDECGKRASRCVDEDLDILCDECGVYMNHLCLDASADHHCDICGEILSDHADVNKNHACDVCGKKMGDHKLADGKHVCDYCGIKMTACADNDADGKCDACGKDMPTKVVEDTKGSINVAIEAAKAQAEAAARAAAEAAAKAAQKVVEKALEDIFAEDSALMGGIESIGGALSDVIADVKANIEAKLEDALNELKELLKKAA